MNPRSSLRGADAFPFTLLIALLFGIASLFPASGASVPGHVEAWGYINAGELQPPAGLEDVVAIAAGNQHNLALRVNGTVVAWGRNQLGETLVPSGLSNVVAISASGHSVALKGNGTLVLWGRQDVTNVPPGLSDVSSVDAGDNYTVALRSNGTVVVWGPRTAVTNVPADLGGVVGIAAGSAHVLALKSDGTVVAWGDNNVGAATPPSGLDEVVAVRADQSTSFAIKSDGTVVAWGGTVLPPGLNGVVDLQDSGGHTIALRTNGEVIAWGYNNTWGEASVPEGLSDVTAIAAGADHNIVLTPRPLILSISSPVVANVGDTVTFSVSASAGPLTYEWQHNGVTVAGATNSSIVLPNVQPEHRGTYRVRVRNSYGSVLSAPMFLTFFPPVITTEPQDLTRYRGENATLGVTADGFAPLSYQWRKDGTNVPGATSTTLTLSFVSSTNAGGYDVRIVDALEGSSTSRVAVLTVIDPRARRQLALTPAVDTSIFSSGGNPQGVGTILAGTRKNGIRDRGLIRFNLASIPAGALIESARLRLTVTRVPPGPANSNFSLHRMLKAWGADATWNNATAGVPWAAPGGANGIDFATVRSATQFVAGGGAYDFGGSAELVADVTEWINNPSANHGWLFKSESESVLGTARHFGSSESSQRPNLFVDYSTRPPRPHLTDLSLAAGRFGFRFAGTAGWIYRVETQADLAGAWTTVTNVTAGAATTPIEISVPHLGGNRFYRVFAE